MAEKTLRIKMLTAVAGARHWHANGDVVDYPAGDAQRLIDRGFAEPVEVAPKKPRRQVKRETPKPAADDRETTDLI